MGSSTNKLTFSQKVSWHLRNKSQRFQKWANSSWKQLLTKACLKKLKHAEVFSAIYKENVWGKTEGQMFYSGTGSDEEYAVKYAQIISEFIKQNNITSVVDLGCGDFRVGKKIIQLSPLKYTGIDVVQDVVDYNNANFKSEDVNFLCKNIVSDKIPKAELCLIRQVLQHLSNNDIKKILRKCRTFKYLIVTEHHPVSNPVPNIDKEPNQNIRLGYNSGVFLDETPFNHKVETLLTVYPQAEANSKIVTFRVYLK